MNSIVTGRLSLSLKMLQIVYKLFRPVCRPGDGCSAKLSRFLRRLLFGHDLYVKRDDYAPYALALHHCLDDGSLRQWQERSVPSPTRDRILACNWFRQTRTYLPESIKSVQNRQVLESPCKPIKRLGGLYYYLYYFRVYTIITSTLGLLHTFMYYNSYERASKRLKKPRLYEVHRFIFYYYQLEYY